MKNVAILHAKFWGDKEKEIKTMFKLSSSEINARGAAHNKFNRTMRKQNVSSSEKFQNKINKAVKTEWRTSPFMVFKNDVSLPDWFTVEPLEDGCYPVFDDPLVKEMLDVLAKRLPDYNRKYLKPFLKKPTQTLLHGDFHGANHMYGEGENKGKIAAIDFQVPGTGMVVCEFFYFIQMSLSAHSLQDIMDIAQEYHDALVAHGVDDYSWEDLKKDIEMLCVEMCCTFISMMTMMKPKTILQVAEGCGEKAEDAKQIFGNGMYAKAFVIVTSIYLNDKERFML